MRVEPLDRSRHNRKAFDCGRPELNDWLAHQAAQAQVRHNSARTFVLTEDGETILGYYALTSHSVDVDAVSAQLARGQLRDYPIPAVLLSRLAVAADHQGRRLGERLLADAVRQVVKASGSIGIALLVVDALDDRAASFYEKYGLERWPTDGLRLFARVKDIARTFAD
jgi:GNAT superfamily N-acetyltransferase